MSTSNLVETLKITRELREIGVGIFFEKEDKLNSMGEQVKWAARKRFANGSVELGSNLYGYEVIDKILTPVPHEAEIVREIFERYANGDGCNKIARALNERGIKRKISQSLWTSNCIRRILANEKYIGDALLQKCYHEDFKPKKNNGEVPQYYVENNHEAIVSRELFEKVQKRIAERKTKIKQAPIKISPFSGKIQCAECGKKYLHRKNNRSTPYEKWIWSCNTYIHQGRKYCSGHNIREKDFLRLFLSAYNEAASFQPHKIKNLDEAMKDLLAQERELVALKVREYIKKEDYETQHADLLSQIRETEEEFSKQTQHSGGIQEHADNYSDRLAVSLDIAEISGYTILFKFKNGAEIRRTFNNDTDRKTTWSRKKEGKIYV